MKINIHFIPQDHEEEVSFHIHQINPSITRAMEVLSEEELTPSPELDQTISDKASMNHATPERTESTNSASDKSFDKSVSERTTSEKTKSPSYLLGKVEDTFYKISLKDIFYFESVDRKIYIYTEKKNYELNEKLYVLEEMLAASGFVRISKSMLLNMNKIYSFVPTFSGNLEALLMNKEKVVISRRYVANLKKQLGMGESI